MEIGRAFSVAVGLFWFAAVGGCGGAPSTEKMVRDANQSNIQRLTNLYTRHQMQKGSQGPRNEGEFKKFIESVDQSTLEQMGVDLTKMDSLFISERDQQPFDIRYGVRASFRGDMVGLIFESEGVEGVRQVGFSTIAVRDIDDDDQYKDLKAGKPFSDGSSNSNVIPGVSR